MKPVRLFDRLRRWFTPRRARRSEPVAEAESVPQITAEPRATRRLPRLRRREVKVVYDEAVVHDNVSVRTHILQRTIRLVLKPTLAVAPLNDQTLELMRSFNAASARGPRSRYVTPYPRELGGVPAETMTHRYGPDSDMTIMYLHGGAFISCGIDTHRRVCERLAYLTGATVHSVDYTQLPEGDVSDSVADAITAYEAVLAEAPDPTKIVVAGDSAGGYLTMKVAELAARRELQAPAALLTFSPLLSVDPEREDKKVLRVRRPKDAYLPSRRVAKLRERWLPEGAAIEGYASPLHAWRYISSPTFFVAVEDEMLRPEVEAMALLLSQNGVEVETHLWKHQVHAFPVMADVFPEAREALQLAADFARRAIGEVVPEREPEATLESETLVGEIVDDADLPQAFRGRRVTSAG